MPRPKTYGKRSRNVYDLWAAPTAESTPKPITAHDGNAQRDDDVGDENEEPKPTETKDRSIKRKSRKGRKALEDKNANEVALTEGNVQHVDKPRRRHRVRHVVVEDEVDRELVSPGKLSADVEALQQALSKAALGGLPQGKGVLQGKQEALPCAKECHKQENSGSTDSVQAAAEFQTSPPQKGVSVHVQCSPVRPRLIQVEDGLQQTISASKSSLLPPTDSYSHHCSALLHQSQHPLSSFSDWSEELSKHFNITKIAEASFGEVYRLSLLTRLPDFSRSDESVFKVIALTPPPETLSTDKRKRNAELRRAEAMSKPADVANEVRLLQRMSFIPGFTNFRDIRILKGQPGEAFVTAFREFNRAQRKRGKEGSVFPDPAKKGSYGDGQLWAAIEMQDAGTDLERFIENGQCKSIFRVWDVFWQVVLSLAKGEEGAEFEHRDLHPGNICIRGRRILAEEDDFDDAEIDITKKANFTSLETTIIDYTLSRAWMASANGVDDIAFHDLAFEAAVFEGDSSLEYQYDIYRYMRSVLFFDDALGDFVSRKDEAAASGRSWRQFHPQTNLVWLHLMLHKMLEQIDWPSTEKPPPRRNKIKYVKWKRANDLEPVLQRVREFLDPAHIGKNPLQSASDLVHLAVGEEWLAIDDVVGEEVEGEEELAAALERMSMGESSV